MNIFNFECLTIYIYIISDIGEIMGLMTKNHFPKDTLSTAVESVMFLETRVPGKRDQIVS